MFTKLKVNQSGAASFYNFEYRNDPKFSDRYAWANCLIRGYTVCHSVCIIWTHYSMVESHSLNFRVITTNFLRVRIFRKFTVSNKNLLPRLKHLPSAITADQQIFHFPLLKYVASGLPSF